MYNNVLSFCSLGVEIDESVTGQRGVYTFRIKGALCHKIGSLLPAEGEQPKFAQIYITDSDPNQQIRQRLQHGGDNIVESILRDLQTMMHRDNPYYSIYKTAKERMGQDIDLVLNLTTFDAKKHDPRRYNLPTASEVGVIIGKDPSDVNATRDLIIEHRGGQLKRISELHSAYLPLRFPLLYPFGEPGWHPKIPFSGADWQPREEEMQREEEGERPDHERGAGDDEEDLERRAHDLRLDDVNDEDAEGAEGEANEERGTSVQILHESIPYSQTHSFFALSSQNLVVLNTSPRPGSMRITYIRVTTSLLQYITQVASSKNGWSMRGLRSKTTVSGSIG